VLKHQHAARSSYTAERHVDANSLCHVRVIVIIRGWPNRKRLTEWPNETSARSRDRESKIAARFQVSIDAGRANSLHRPGACVSRNVVVARGVTRRVAELNTDGLSCGCRRRYVHHDNYIHA